MELHFVPELSRGGINGNNGPIGGDDHEMSLGSCTKIEASDHTLIGWILDEIDNFVCPTADNNDHLSAYSLITRCVFIHRDRSYADLYIDKVFLSDDRGKAIGFRE
jgi:hypothetical protein